METNKISVALIAVLCLAAGAGGTYLVVRSNAPASSEPATMTATGDDQGALGASAALAPEATAAAPEPRVQTVPAPAPVRRSNRPADAVAAPAPRVVEPVDQTDVPVIAQPVPESPSPAPVELPRAFEPPTPEFLELVVSADSVIGLRLESTLTSEQAQIEDRVIARVTRDVRVGDRVAIPSGSRVDGEVTLVERGGKVRERARLGIRFTSVLLADGTRVTLNSDPIYREGDAPGGESAAKIGGGALGGAIIGGILGGAKGAVIGGSAGAGAGTAVVVAGGRNPATFQAGTPVTIRITRPAVVTVDN